MIITDIERQTKQFRVGTFVNTICEQMTADMDIQSPNRWTPKDQSSFIESVLTNKAPSLFVVAKIDSCLANSFDKLDQEYYTRWQDKGYTYLNLDSWNRTNTLILFYKDEVTIPNGEYSLGGVRYVVDKTNNTYSTMDDDLRIIFESRTITVEVLTSATRRDLSTIFDVVNRGVALNAAERRNPILTAVAGVCRDFGKKYATKFPNINGLTHNNRRDVDDFFAGLFAIFVLDDFKNGKTTANITTGVLRNIYEDEDYGSFVSPFSTFTKKFMKELLSFSEFPTILHKNFILDLFTIWRSVDRQKTLKITEPQKFITDAYKAYVKLLDDKKTTHEYSNGRSAIYSELLRSRQTKMNQIRQRLILENIQSLDVYTVEMKEQRLATKETKLIVYNRDGGKTPEGVEIKPEELYDPTVVQGGHVKMAKNGGSAEPNNIVMQTRKDNLKLKTDLPAELIPESLRDNA